MRLTINTLGKFQVTDGNAVIGDSNLHSNMIFKLFMYMILYRDKTLTIEDISMAIWSEEDSENPAGALKNLVYRLRKILRSHFGDEEYILSERGSYRWNPQIKVNIDIEKFEEMINLAKQENVYERAIIKYEQAVALYQGNFMKKLLDMHWILSLCTYYHSLYLSAVKSLAELYIKMEEYEKLDSLCTNALKFENTDEQLYCYQIEARMRCGDISLALESYERAREIMEKELGVRKTTILNKVYEELLAMSKGQNTYSIREVHEDMTEQAPEGVFLCGYPVFKEIYHLEVRKNSRSGEISSLLLMTVEGKKDDQNEIANFRVKHAMSGIEETIRESLRVGDVAARYSDSQFIVLLPGTDQDLAMLVANRLIAKLYEKDQKYNNVDIKINIEQVTGENGKMIS
jgi:DNA-binding SARP family transcriptional activator